MSDTYICIMDFTSIVFCNDDWTPNYIEHVVRGKTIKGDMVKTPKELVGYQRIEGNAGYLLIALDDWRPTK